MTARVLCLFLLLFLNAPKASSKVRVGLELEFDAKYFLSTSPISRYIKMPFDDRLLTKISKGKKSSYTFFFMNDAPFVGQLPEEFPVLSNAPKDIQELLSRFELSWDHIDAPPQVIEIRHKENLHRSPEESKEDLRKLLELFSSSQKEKDQLIQKLSSHKARAIDELHLNLHVNISNDDAIDREQLARLLQILTCIRFLSQESPEVTLRMFSSTHSSYLTDISKRNLIKLKAAHFIESRKRSQNIFDDIDELHSLMEMPVAEALNKITQLIRKAWTPAVSQQLIKAEEVLRFKNPITHPAVLVRDAFNYIKDQDTLKSISDSFTGGANEFFQFLLPLQESEKTGVMERFLSFSPQNEKQLEPHILNFMRATPSDCKSGLGNYTPSDK